MILEELVMKKSYGVKELSWLYLDSSRARDILS